MSYPPYRNSIGDACLKHRKKETTIPRHSHCLVCGATIPENETFCSNKCRDEYEKIIKKQRYLRFTAFLPVIIVTIFFILLFLLRGS